MRRIVFALLAVFAAALLASVASPARAQTMNMVRLVHASPDAPAVDIFVNGQAVVSNVSFFAVSPYLPLADGTYQVAISPAGRGTDYSVWVGDLTVQGGFTGTAVAANTLENFQVILFEDNLSAPAAGEARVNVLHLAPDAMNVDIKAAGSSENIFSNVPFGEGAVVDVPAGTYSFDITPAGSSTVAFTTPSLRFESGWIYTLYATGLIEEGGFWVQSSVDRVGGMTAMGLKSTGTGKLVAR